jgi:tRNA-intron endonuclease, archaea type
MKPLIYLIENKVIVKEKQSADRLHSKGFGERKGNELILDLFEAVYLLKKNKLNITDLRGKELNEEIILKKALKKDKSFYSKFIVFEKLRSTGFVIKTGLKFGSDFRVYPKGKKPGQAHTQWTLNVFSDEQKISLPELSRLVRLTQNIKATALIAVADRENDVNFYELKRIVL